MTVERDPFWPNVVLALPFEGANRSTDFLNPANTGGATAHMNPEILSGVSPFGGPAGVFKGDFGYLAFTPQLAGAFDFSQGDLTIDFWLKPMDTYPAGQWYRLIMSGPNSSYSSLAFNIEKISTTNARIGIGVPVGGMLAAISTASIVCGETQHIAITMQGGSTAVTRIYRNGVDITSASKGLLRRPDPADNYLTIGHDPSIQNSYSDGAFKGVLDDLRITRAIRWDGPFTPPTAPMPTAGYHVRGRVADVSGNPLGRKLRVYERETGRGVGEGFSSPISGEYNILVSTNKEVQVVLLDDIAGVLENDQILRTTPEYDNGL